MSGTRLRAQGIVREFRASRVLSPWRAESGHIRALGGVSVEIAGGETLGIVGESGSGKSTLGRILLALDRPDAGRVIFEDRDLHTLSPGELRELRPRMQMVFQDPRTSLNPRMRVGELVGEALEAHAIASGSEREARVAEMLRRVGLEPEHAARHPHELSGGQRQRVGIARAMVLLPDLVVWDEPVSSLDMSLRARILELLLDLQAERGVSYALITHDIEVARAASDRLVVMYLGRVVEQGATETLLADPQHPFTRLLVASVPGKVTRAERRGLYKAIPTRDEAVRKVAVGCAYAPRCPEACSECLQGAPPELRPLGPDHAVACAPRQKR